MAVRGALGPLSGLICKLLIQLVREILHLPEKSQGKITEFQKLLGVVTMIKNRD